MDVREQADEWVRMRRSEDHEEQQAAAWAELPLAVWLDVLDQHPEMATWVAHAKRAPTEIAEALIDHPDWQVRLPLASQRRLAPHLRRLLAEDPDEAVRRAARRFLNSESEER